VGELKPAMSKNDPAATDLDYYSKPENYTGSNLQALQKFKADKTKEDNANKKKEKKVVIKDAKYYFFRQYKNILRDVIFIDELWELEQDAESEPEDDTDEEVEGAEDTSGRDTGPGESLKPIEEHSDEGKTQRFDLNLCLWTTKRLNVVF